MGTNFYLIDSSKICPTCGRGEKTTHIGKSSSGWHFSLHVMPEEGINNLEDWKELILNPDNFILDEYGGKVDPAEMIEVITSRSHPKKIDKGSSWYAENHAEPGLNNLARSIVDGRHCVGHGEGTYDYITGEFS